MLPACYYLKGNTPRQLTDELRRGDGNLLLGRYETDVIFSHGIMAHLHSNYISPLLKLLHARLVQSEVRETGDRSLSGRIAAAQN